VAVPAVDAHQLARISYRQLDHWARQGWVAPSLDPGRGRSGRRLYSAGDVVRLDLLRHLAISSVNMAVAGPAVAAFEMPDGDVRVLWGPVGTKDGAGVGLEAVPAGEVLGRLERGGAYVVYNPAGVRHRLAVVADRLPRPVEEAAVRRRRSA
jgi:MerR HTH family regulatory protein